MTNELAAGETLLTSKLVNTSRLPAVLLGVGLFISSARAQAPEPNLPRPGSVVAGQVVGDVKITASDQTKPVKADDRLRVGSTIATGRRSLVELVLSNGAKLELGAESELEIEEFGQQPFSSSIKVNELKEEPTISRTKLRLLRGDVSGDVKRLKTERGSSFTLTLVAGTLRLTEGQFEANVRMTEIGLGVCTVDVPAGIAEFEPLGGSFGRVTPGRQIGFTIEIDKVTGNVRLSDLPRAGDAPVAKKQSPPATTPAPEPKVDAVVAPKK